MIDLDIGTIKGYDNIIKFLKENDSIFNNKDNIISFDIETKGLLLRGNKLLGFGIGFSKTKSRYIVTRELNIEQLKNIFKIFNSFKCKVVLHNAYFDISTLNYLLGFNVRWTFCTYIITHTLHSDYMLYSSDKDRKGSLGLKSLCKKYYPELYGYEDELEKIRQDICKEKGLLKEEFTYDLFSDEILAPYGNYDVLVTYTLFVGLSEEIKNYKENGWVSLLDILKIKHKVTNIYINSKVKGIKVDREIVYSLNEKWTKILENNFEKIIEYEQIKETENLLYMQKYNSLIEKRQKLFDSKYEERMNKIREGKYTKSKLDKDRENIFKLTQNMLNNIEKESRFNIKSSQHKSVLFFDVLGLTPLKYNKPQKISGLKTPKTDKEFLEKYSYIPLVDSIREYLLYVKGVDGFLGVNDERGKNGLWNLTSEDYPINHPNSNLQGTITHRIAQDKVNLQQLPSRGDLSELKKCIIPLESNHRIVALDYSSCELYILGALSKEPNLLRAIKEGLDLHSNMAYEVWGDEVDIDNDLEKDIKSILSLSSLPYSDSKHTLATLSIPHDKKLLIIKELMGNTLRYNAKSINFGVPYGISPKGLANNMKKLKKEAEQLLNTYMTKNAGIRDYMDLNKDLLCKNGYVEGYHGQRLYMNKSLNVDWRGLEKVKYDDKKDILKELRKSTNYIIQSENAFVLYEALIRLDEKLKKLKLDDKVFLLTTIYDACYFSVSNDVTDNFISKILREVFEVNYTEDVKFKIDIQSGNNFKDLKDI